MRVSSESTENVPKEEKREGVNIIFYLGTENFNYVCLSMHNQFQFRL